MFDPFSFENHADPYPVYARMRADHPVFHNPERGFFAISRFEDVQRIERDWTTFSHSEGVDIDEFGALVGDGDFLDMDPPRHDILRNAVRRFFTPKAIAALEQSVRARVRTLLAQARAESHLDLAESLAWRLPLEVICELLGVPSEDADTLLALVHDSEYRAPHQTLVPAKASSAIGELRAYFAELCATRLSTPRDDVISAIAAMGAQDPVSLPREALPGTCFLLFVAGVSTTASLIGNSISALAGRHEDWAELTKGVTSAAAAIEELLRYEAPIQYFRKTATTDVTLHGVTIPAGAPVVVLYGSANRDESIYTEPDRLDLQRDFRKHKAFGDGIHFCLGAHLARLEGRVALQEFFSAVNDYEIDGSELIPLHHFRGFLHLTANVDWA